VTLGQLLARGHEGIQGGATADCPVCGGTLLPYGLGAACGDCGSRLS
jgi:DNA-directed RNA polymerase subunit RPC12/RpoP